MEHGIEGRQFYTMRLETMRDMRIPNVSMQDLIQLNAAIYRLNASGTAAAAAAAAAASSSQGQQEQASNAQILGHPLQPLRPPRPSWTLRRNDPQPTYSHQVQLTANGMVARPIKIQAQAQSQTQTQRVPFSINTGVAVAGDASATSDTSDASAAKTWSSRYSAGLPTYRSRNSAHVDSDELPFVRPGQAAWSPQLQPAQRAPPAAPGTRPRRRSAVIDDLAQLPAEPPPEPRVPRPTPAPLPPRLAPTLPPVAGLPARYHGTNQPHSPYYAHGAGSFSYRGVVGGGGSPAYATVAQSGGGSSSPAYATATEPGRYLTRRGGSRQRGSRNATRGLFEPSLPALASAPRRPPPPHPYSKGTAAAALHARRASISPVLSALKPGNFHIANLLPDDLDSSESDVSDAPSSAAQAAEAQQPLPGEPATTPLSVVNVLPGTSISPHASPPPPPPPPQQEEQYGRGSNHHVRLQMAFGGDVEDLPSAGLRRVGSHVRSPSMPASLESSLPASKHSGGFAAATGDRPHSTFDNVRHGDDDDGGGGSQMYVRGEGGGALTILDAESMGDDSDDALQSEMDRDHFDLVENAPSVSWSEDRMGDGELAVWDAEEIGGDRSAGGDAPAMMAVFDAEEIEYSEDEFGHGMAASPVRIDAYETESIFSVPATQYEHDEDEDEYSAMPAPVISHNDDREQQQQQPSPPLQMSDIGNSATLADRQHQQSSAFKVKGVRHVLSYGADFDKTAATLLSSIKTDIAKKVAVTASSASRPVSNMPSAASIAAAIELHQLKQQQQQQQVTVVPRRQESDEQPMGSQSAERHTSRLSGFFGFGPRTHKPHQTPTSTITAASAAIQQSQSPAGTSLAQSQHLTLGAAAGSAAGLRVVTDFQSLRGVGGLAVGTADPSSAEGKKSASPSTLPRRWRVPFRQRANNAAGVVGSEQAHFQQQQQQQLSSESPSSVVMDRGHESEASTSATPKAESMSQRTFRRSRYRAGTTSDIESPLTAAALLSTMDRPYSMVESGTSASISSAGTGLTPGSATIAVARPPPMSFLPPGAPQTAPRTITDGNGRRRTQAHFQSSTSPISPLVGRMFHDGRRRSGVGIVGAGDTSPLANASLPLSSVFVRREQDSEFVQVDISKLASGAAIAERLVSTLNSATTLSSLGAMGDHQFAVQSADGSQWLLDSDGELWTHCIRARPESPAAFVLCDGDSHQNASSRLQTGSHRVRFQTSRLLGGREGGASSSSGSESEICSAVPVFGRMPLPPFARSGFPNGGYDTTGSASPSSFVTANSYSPQVAVTRGVVGQLAIDDDYDDDDVILADRVMSVSSDPSLSSSSLSRTDSWTLMFVTKEFVVPKPSSSSQDLAATAVSAISLAGSATGANDDPMQHTQAAQVFDAASDDEDDLWGGAAPTTGADDDYDPVAEAMRADLAERQAAEDHSDDDCGSIASSTRTLPSTMRFTRGMRATLLERRPSRNMHGRPTADMIGEQLDEYFPDHDLDRPIVQSVPMDEGLLPSHEFHIILDEDDGTAVASYQQGARGRRHLLKALGPEDDDSSGGALSLPPHHPHPHPPNSGGIGRRKSVRMLVQETRNQRHQRRARSRVVADKRAVVAEPAVVVAKPPRPVVRRQSTKLWGCIPEEIRPRDERTTVLTAPAVMQGGVPRGNDEIVRRALSLLRKPEPNPQAEKDIVEAAIKCGDSSTVGSTRAHFAHERARLQQQQMITADDDVGSGGGGGGGSVNDAARALFAKYGIATAGIKIQWIKGKLIGKGSFGHVHVAINAATGEVIAVKQIRLPASLCAAASDEAAAPVGSSRKRRGGRAAGLLEEAIRMMYTEVELLRDLDHENVVQLLGFEVAGGVMSMFLEYVPGGTVQSLVQQHGPLPESVVHSFLRQIVAGLGYLHASGILHRDIKGANILVDETGTCKISDFGVSRKIDCTSLAAAMASNDVGGSGGMRKRSIKVERRIMGTVPFMAPEVARSSQYTAAADIWSLGCVVVQMWSGRGPWDELQEPQVFFKLGRGEAPPIPDDLTEPGLDFCKNCFAADPLARWTAAELGRMQFAQVPREYEYPYAC